MLSPLTANTIASKPWKYFRCIWDNRYFVVTRRGVHALCVASRGKTCTTRITPIVRQRFFPSYIIESSCRFTMSATHREKSRLELLPQLSIKPYFNAVCHWKYKPRASTDDCVDNESTLVSVNFYTKANQYKSGKPLILAADKAWRT